MRRISPLSWVLIVVGVLLVVLGIVYFTTTAPDLPGFIPGHVEKVRHSPRKYSKRGIASIAVALVAFGAAYYDSFVRTKPASSSSASSAEPSV